MILQSVYTIYLRSGDQVKFESDEGQVVSMSVQDWYEMGEPDKVSVQVMRLLSRTMT